MQIAEGPGLCVRAEDKPMETQLFFPFPQFNDDDDDKVAHDKQSASFFDDANGNMEDKEPDDVSGEPLTGCCGEHDRSDALNLLFGEVCLRTQSITLVNTKFLV